MFQQTPATTALPPLDEERFVARLVEMPKPKAGERAILVYDPGYYPGITMRLRDELHKRGVQTYLLVEDSAEMIRMDDSEAEPPLPRERDVVAALTPLFQSVQIFYWMPERAYVGDLRWERVLGASKARGVHFHWMLPFPGGRTAEQVAKETATKTQQCLDVDLVAHAKLQQRLAKAIRGQTLHITTEGGTDLRVRVPRDQWIHFGDGDISAEKAAVARSIRDRSIELPVGMFAFIPDPAGFQGTVASKDVQRAGPNVNQGRFTFDRGRISKIEPDGIQTAVRAEAKRIGPDGDKVSVLWLNTNPFIQTGVQFDVGSNWENGATNRATRMRRMALRLPDASVWAGDRLVMRAGVWLWDAIP